MATLFRLKHPVRQPLHRNTGGVILEPVLLITGAMIHLPVPLNTGVMIHPYIPVHQRENGINALLKRF
jgi:hypothetical protein